MRALILFALISLSSPDLGAARQGSVEGQYTIAVDVELVVFNLTVTDDKGRHVSGLSSRDFLVHEGNRPQNITLFKAEDVPISVGIIIDNSGSMHDKHVDVANAALAFVSASNTEDEMFVVNFNEHVYMGLPQSIRFTNDPDLIRSALLRRAPSGLTALYDAMAVGIEHLKSGTRDRKALIVFSDGGDNASRRRLEDVVRIARQSSATIYTIGIYDDIDPDRNPRVLRQIAGLSGGRAYFPDSLGDLGQVWQEIAAGIRSQYTIGYHSTNLNRDGIFRKVDISVSRDRGRVTTRDGYIPAGKSMVR